MDERNCKSSFLYDQKDLPTSNNFMNRLKETWPQFQNNYFWKNEWNKHGTCYLNLTVESGSQESDLDIFERYFTDTLERTEQINKNKRFIKAEYSSSD